ncbi:unnamed protein product [Ilex paraguariensis]|uniref:Exocyst component Exo84 C-terminal domain-containing protein n=1 Tax=Ilex paraguariensis TaxID=185542 RepID=A0ABC8RYC6_9AQUA
MESTSSTSRFRFRDHNEETADGDLTNGRISSDSSSVSSDGDVESEIESMTGKGIKHLCSELLELKRESDEDFQKSIFSNYSAFLGIFEEMQGMENELMQLKHHVSTQKRLVKDLTDGIYMMVIADETVESMIGVTLHKSSPLSLLEAHTEDVSEILDTLLSEHRVDEVLAFLEIEAGTFQSMQLEENLSSDVFVSYTSMISERRAMLADQLIKVAENPRLPPAELQKALAGLCRLGNNSLAAKLLLKYYHSRILSGICDLQSSKTNFHGIYIRETAKFVFSMISQAARSFVVIYGETSPYTSELMKWAFEETEVFSTCLNKYIKSISEISGGLSTAVEAVQFAMAYCSLLETQRIVLQPCLIKHIRDCMEEVLQIHVDHFKKVIYIFTSADAWVLGRYLVSGIFCEGRASVVIGQQLEYCMLTNSGRKFVTLLQAITADLSPLVSLQMEGPILRGLVDLFMEYIVVLERALATDMIATEEAGSRINLAETLAQQVSLLANLSTLVQFFSGIVRNVFKNINHLNFEIDSYILYIEEACGRLRTHFCEQFIHKILSCEGYHGLTVESCINSQEDGSNMFGNLVPSVCYQVCLSSKSHKLVGN